MAENVMEWIEVASVPDVSPGSSRVIRLLGQPVALFNVQGRLYAINNTCPHQGGPLGEGTLEGEVVTCPWHEWKFSVRTGCPVSTPTVKTYPVRIHSQAIQVAVSADDLERYREANQEKEPAALVEKYLDPVSEILEQINLGKTLDEVFGQIYVSLQKVVPHNRLGIALIDPLTGQLVQVKTKSDRRILLDNGFSARISGSSLEQILERGEARIIDDLREHLTKRPSIWTRLIVEEGMRSSLTLPLKVQGKPIGVVFFTSVRPHGFSETHVAFLKKIAGQLSILVEKGQWTSQLAESHERYQALFEMSNEGIFICSALEEPLVTFNENLCEWLGYARQELAHRSLRELMTANKFERASRILPKLEPRKDPVTFETEFLKKNGQPLPVELRLVAIQHGDGHFLQGFIRDLTEVKALREQLRSRYSFENIVAKNAGMRDIFDLIRQVAPMSTTVLINGESGTGKELVARAIHRYSPRRNKPLITVNCGALVENLLESELFGHVKGAFTGAGTTRAGRFERAHGGTIFLDEIGDLSLATQVKLLRILQEGEFEKVGSTVTQKIDVRIIAATNRDLRAAVAAGEFREDLFYRLNVVPMKLPSLRERRDDIPLLVDHFIEQFNRRTGKAIQKAASEVMDILMEYPYPGNIRELENIIEHAFVKSRGTVIEKEHLPAELIGDQRDIVTFAMMSKNPLAALEQELVKRALDQCGGHMQAAAKPLGISRTTLWRKLRPAE